MVVGVAVIVLLVVLTTWQFSPLVGHIVEARPVLVMLVTFVILVRHEYEAPVESREEWELRVVVAVLLSDEGVIWIRECSPRSVGAATGPVEVGKFCNVVEDSLSSEEEERDIDDKGAALPLQRPLLVPVWVVAESSSCAADDVEDDVEADREASDVTFTSERSSPCRCRRWFIDRPATMVQITKKERKN